MEAKDTVIDTQAIQKEFEKWQDAEDEVGTFEEWLCRVQAEITWKAREPEIEESHKAGMEEGNQKTYEIGVEDGRAEGVAEGVKDVVEFIYNRTYHGSDVYSR